jgi:hypothetical protein
VMPPFKDGSHQFTEQENVMGYRCALVRIHVEHAIRRLKKFKIFHFDDHSLYNKVDSIILCIAFMCNNMTDLIKSQ